MLWKAFHTSFLLIPKGYYLADTFQMPEFGGFVMEGLQIFRSFEPMEDGFAGIRGARFTVGERAAGFAAAAGEKWLRERKSVPWYALRAAIQNIPRSVRQ